MLRHVVGGVVFLIIILGGLLFSDTAKASIAGPVIYQVQVGATGVTNKEYISVYNSNSLPVEVTDWCLKYGSNVVTGGVIVDTTNLGCLTPPDIHTKLWLAGHSYFIAASTAFKTDFSSTVFDINFASQSIANKDRYVRLVDANNAEIDRVGWGAGIGEAITASNPTSPNMLQRKPTSDSMVLQDTDNNSLDFVQSSLAPILTTGISEEVVLVDVCPNINDLQTTMPPGFLADENGDCQADICQNIDGLQLAIPAGYESSDGINCTLIPLENAEIFITEVLPNVTSTDTGKEFIELYNPNNRAVNLKGYKLELGPTFSKNYIFDDQELAPGEYKSFSDTITGIVLPNTNATLRLTAPAGNIVDASEIYDSPADDMAWALINDTWQYTNQPTPSAANAISIEPGLGGGDPTDNSTLEPCPAGKFRNPDTNRCKNIEDVSTSLTPCAADQTRNPETNRCRSVLVASASLTPCQLGQERNPETNRCRSIASAASASLKPCAANQERNPETNRCRNKSSSSAAAGKIKDIEASQVGGAQNGWMITGGVVAAAAGYGAWEWRSEMMNGFRRFRQLFGKSPLSD